MRVLRICLALIAVAVVASACSIPYPPCELDAVRYPSGARLRGDSLRLGVINASPLFTSDLPDPLRQTQASIAVLDDVRWGRVEPEPPHNGIHTYEWDDESVALDTRVHAYQQAGFELVMVLRAWNTWARSVAPQGGLAAAGASTPPKPDNQGDYAAWIAAVVERYDADGIEDAPNLLDVDGDGQPDPVRYFQIETEAVTGVWWQSANANTATGDYLDLLRSARTAAKAANPDAQILLAGIPALDLLDGYPSSAGLEDVVRNINPAVCGAIVAYDQLLAAHDAYDIAVVHSAADYTGLFTLADWVQTLAGRDVPVWVNGGTSAPALTGDPTSLSVNPLFPVRGEAFWSSIQNVFDAQHQQVERWYRAEQAKLAFKKWVFAAWSGFDVLVLGLEQDRPQYENENLGQRDLAFQGILDPADGFSVPGQRPAVPSLALAQAQLSGYSHLQRLQGLGAGVQAFEFMVEGLPVYALWYDDGVAQGPNDAPAAIEIQLPVRAPQLTAMIAPTERGQTGPIIEILTPTDGLLSLTLTETPIILRGEWVATFLPQIVRP